MLKTGVMTAVWIGDLMLGVAAFIGVMEAGASLANAVENKIDEALVKHGKPAFYNN